MDDTGDSIIAGEGMEGGGLKGGAAGGNLLGMAYVVIRGDDSRLGADMAGAAHKAKSMLDTAMPAEVIEPGIDLHAFSRASHILKEGFTFEGIAAGAATMGAGFLAAQAPLELLHKGIETFKEDLAEASREAKEAAQANRLLDAMLESTQHGAGLSAQSLKELAHETAEMSGQSTTAITQFESDLLRFQNVHTEVFKRAVKTAADWSASGKDMATISFVLGRALNDPTRAASMLRRAQIQLTQEQERSITSFMREGEIAKAQGVILDAIDAKYGGLAARMLTPAGRLRGQIEDLNKELGDMANKYEPLKLRAKIVRLEFEKSALEAFYTGMDRAMREAHIVNNEGNLTKFGRVTAQTAGTMTGRMFTPFGTMRGINDDLDRLKATANGDEKLWNDLVRRKAIQDRVQADYDAKQKEKAYEDLSKMRSEHYEGFFDPLVLAKKIQEAMLGGDKQDRVIDLLKASNSIQNQILDGVRRHPLANAPVAVATP